MRTTLCLFFSATVAAVLLLLLLGHQGAEAGLMGNFNSASTSLKTNQIPVIAGTSSSTRACYRTQYGSFFFRQNFTSAAGANGVSIWRCQDGDVRCVVSCVWKHTFQAGALAENSLLEGRAVKYNYTGDYYSTTGYLRMDSFNTTHNCSSSSNPPTTIINAPNASQVCLTVQLGKRRFRYLSASYKYACETGNVAKEMAYTGNSRCTGASSTTSYTQNVCGGSGNTIKWRCITDANSYVAILERNSAGKFVAGFLIAGLLALVSVLVSVL